MKIFFWNVRGLGKVYRRHWVKDHILTEDLDVVALQETIKQDFSDLELKDMARNKDFVWDWVPTRGHSGGLLTGINNENFELEQSAFGSFFLASLIRDRKTNHRFWVLNIYGPAQHHLSADFLKELHDFCVNEHLPILMGGFQSNSKQ